MAYKGKCSKCGDQELRVRSDETFRLAVPWLSSFFQREVEFACTVCGKVIQRNATLVDRGNRNRSISLRPLSDGDVVRQKHQNVMHQILGKEFVGIQYPAVFREGENVLLPTSEGYVQDGTVVDRYGAPDLMADFAEEYLRVSQALMSASRLPGNLKEVMPSLLLFVTATELALKAFYIRSEKVLRTSHSLLDLYEKLDSEYKEEVGQRFAGADSNLALATLGAEIPKVEHILRLYSETYGGESSVYMDVRYYAEPTTKLHSGSNLLKFQTPYPIFLPDVVRALIDAYWFFSGPNRLRRLGGDITKGVNKSANDNHGEWGLIPSSLDLVVVSVPQNTGMDAKTENLKTYKAFRASYPTGLTADWKYGGNTLLFYRPGRREFADGKQVLDGLECRVWSNGRMGLHSRDLNRLADALETACCGADSIGLLTPGQ